MHSARKSSCRSQSHQLRHKHEPSDQRSDSDINDHAHLAYPTRDSSISVADTPFTDATSSTSSYQSVSKPGSPVLVGTGCHACQSAGMEVMSLDPISHNTSRTLRIDHLCRGTHQKQCHKRNTYYRHSPSTRKFISGTIFGSPSRISARPIPPEPSTSRRSYS